MLAAEICWRIFESTGSIVAYMLYKRFLAASQRG